MTPIAVDVISTIKPFHEASATTNVVTKVIISITNNLYRRNLSIDKQIEKYME
jgi:hypothetical protein